MEQDEQELLLLVARDLRASFPLLVMRYQGRLVYFARRLTSSTQDAEDIVQEALIGAYVSLENYPPERIVTLKLQAWLYRIVLNVWNHHSRNVRLHMVPLYSGEEGAAIEIEDREEERPETLF